MKKEFTEFIKGRIYLDGGTGSELVKYGVPTLHAEVLNIEHPELIREIHEKYLAAGSNGADICRNVDYQPMIKAMFARRVGVVADDGKAPGAPGSVAPGQLRRNVAAGAAVGVIYLSCRHHGAGLDVVTGYGKRLCGCRLDGKEQNGGAGSQTAHGKERFVHDKISLCDFQIQAL